MDPASHPHLAQLLVGATSAQLQRHAERNVHASGRDGSMGDAALERASTPSRDTACEHGLGRGKYKHRPDRQRNAHAAGHGSKFKWVWVFDFVAEGCVKALYKVERDFVLFFCVCVCAKLCKCGCLMCVVFMRRKCYTGWLYLHVCACAGVCARRVKNKLSNKCNAQAPSYHREGAVKHSENQMLLTWRYSVFSHSVPQSVGEVLLSVMMERTRIQANSCEVAPFWRHKTWHML